MVVSIQGVSWHWLVFFLEEMTKNIASTLVEVILIKRLQCVVIELQARCLLVCLRRSLQLADAGTGVKHKDGLARHPMNWQDGTTAMVHHLLGKGVLVRFPSEHFVVVDELFVEEFYATWGTGTLSGWCALGGHEREKMEVIKSMHPSKINSGTRMQHPSMDLCQLMDFLRNHTSIEQFRRADENTLTNFWRTKRYGSQTSHRSMF